jgi:hypothetical protein
MDTTKRPLRTVLVAIAALSCGIGCATLTGCASSADDAQPSESAQGAVATTPGVPSARQATGASPRELLVRYQAHSPPQLASADQVGRFLDWVGASHVDEKEDARRAIVAAASNQAVVEALIVEVERVKATDHSRALLALAILGETKNPKAQAFFTAFVRRALPQQGTVIDGEIMEQTQAAQLQGKAIDGLAYINSDSANKVVMDVIAHHPSKIVRAEAINAYLWNHGDSVEARKTLSQFVRTDEAILLDRVRRVTGESAASFNAKLAQFLKQHPEVVPPDPERSKAAATPAQPQGRSLPPPAL